MRGALALALLLGACISPSAVECGDKLCANGDVCTPGGCADPGDALVCSGMPDGTTCNATNGATGACEGGACRTFNCGNGIVEPGETCDGDAGVDPTKGEQCSPDCRHIEVCGNSVVDPGESCDDGNTNPADGCDACVATTWQVSVLVGGTVQATTIPLPEPRGLAGDRDGNFYVADQLAQLVYRVDATGVVTVVAGTGTAGYNGDDRLAVTAQIDRPVGVAVDNLGNVYIAESFGYRVRKVDARGIITTIAGTGANADNGDGGPAVAAGLDQPYGVAVDGLGQIYISENGSGYIRKIDVTGTISTIAGNGSLNYSGDGGPATSAGIAPTGLAIDVDGTIYFGDESSRVRAISPGGIISTIAGTGIGGFSGDGGPATAAQLQIPYSVAVDAQHDVYIADGQNHRIRMVTPAGTISTVAGGNGFVDGGDGGPVTAASFDTINWVAFDGLQRMLISEGGFGFVVRRVDTNGIVSRVAGTGLGVDLGDGEAATVVAFANQTGIDIDAAGNLVFSSSQSTVSKVAIGGVTTTLAGTGVQGYGGDGGAATAAQLNTPAGTCVDHQGRILIADTLNNRIRRIDTNGVITTIAGTGVAGFSGDGGAATSAQLNGAVRVEVDAADNIYISDYYNQRIRRIDGAGVITTYAGNGTAGYLGDGGPANKARINFPQGLRVDASGRLCFADLLNYRVRCVDSGGAITTLAGTGTAGYNGDNRTATTAQLAFPTDVAFDGTGGVYIGDNGRVRQVDTAGIITTAAGTGVSATDLDGGPATAVPLNGSGSIVVASNGDVYISTSNPGRIRRLHAGRVTTVAGPIDPPGVGPIARARLADPRALAITPSFTLFAAGASGTVESLPSNPTWLSAVSGRYPQQSDTQSYARYRSQTFGTVSGIAYDAATSTVFLTETEADRVHAVSMVDPSDDTTWTITALGAGTGFADGALATAKFRHPTGLYLDNGTLYVADSGNHVVRAIDLTAQTVRTIAGTPGVRGFAGDRGSATTALLYNPTAVTTCANGDVFVADTGNNRIRRIAGGIVTTVLGDGTAASSGDGAPANLFPVDGPRGLACDAPGNVIATSRNTVRLLAADDSHVVDGTGAVETIYGRPPRDAFPSDVTRCLTGIAVADATTLEITDSCTGLLIQLHRAPGMP